MRGGEPSLWCSRLESGPRGRLRLFCFPHGGATSYVYAAWAEHLPADIELWGVHPPGRGTRFGETAIDRVVPLVASLADNLPLSGDLPCVFFGHSVGALVAFELARTLGHNRGEGPRHLFVSGYRAPHLPLGRAPLHDAPVAILTEALNRYDGIPRELLDNAEALELLLPAIRADFAAAETYQYRPGDPLSCPITAYGGRADAEVGEPELRCWCRHTSADFALHMVDGNHLFPFHSRTYLRLFTAALTAVSRSIG